MTKRKRGRPALPVGAAKKMIAMRIDPHVLARLKRIAATRGLGYQTLINDVMTAYVKELR